MRRMRRGIWRFLVIASILFNFVLLVLVLALGILIFEIKREIAQPLVEGLHSSFIGLDQATIDWTIPVRTDLPIELTVPINAGTITSQVAPPPGQPTIPGETLVTLTRAVPISINNAFIQSNDLTLRNARVDITLPQGTVLPVALNMEVGLNTEIPVDLDVRAVIPLSQTQLHDPFENLRLLFDPFARGLQNLPDSFPEAIEFAGEVITGNNENLLETETDYTLQPWPGFSRTAGLNYDLLDIPFPLPNVPVETGIIPSGGLRGFDAQLRPQVYDSGGPSDINDEARARMDALGIPSYYYDGTFSDVALNPTPELDTPDANPAAPGDAPPPSGVPGDDSAAQDDPEAAQDLGIIPPG